MVVLIGPPLTFILQKHWAFGILKKTDSSVWRSHPYTYGDLILTAFCVAIIVSILAVALNVNGLGPIDDHHFIATIFQGERFGAYILPTLGRYFPLTAQEYVLVSKLLEPSPFLFQLINCIKIILCGCLLMYCIILTEVKGLIAAVMWGTVICSIGFINSAFRYHVGEINALILLLIFIVNNLVLKNKDRDGSITTTIAALAGIVAMFLAFFYKELIFSMAIAFSSSEIIRHVRNKVKKAPWHLYLLLFGGLFYIAVYSYWRAHNVTSSYASYQSLSPIGVAELFIKNDPFIILIVLPITVMRVFLGVINPVKHSIYDSFLIAACSYMFAFMSLGIFNTYYLLPVYGFATCGIAGLMAGKSFGKFNGMLLSLAFVMGLNNIPVAMSDMLALKSVANAHYKFVHFLSEWIFLNPLPNAEPRNLVLEGVSPGNGIEMSVSLKTFLTSLGVNASEFSIKFSDDSDNKIVSNAYGLSDQTAYKEHNGDLLIFNPYRHNQTIPPLLTPSLREIFRSDAEWSVSRQSILDRFQSCLFKHVNCFPGDLNYARYDGYVAFLKTKELSLVETKLFPVTAPSYRLGPMQLSSRMKSNATVARDVLVVNSGDETWPVTGASKDEKQVYLSYVWVASNGKVIAEGNRAKFFEPIPKNGVAKVTLVIKAPALPGKYNLIISPLQEGVRWFYSDNEKNRGKEVEVY